MSATSKPFGCRPVGHFTGGTVRTIGVPGGIATGYASTIPLYSPVKFTTSGVLNVVSAADLIAGIFAGCEYVDSSGHGRVGHWPASTTATAITAYIYRDPAIEYMIQCDGSLAITAVGDEANFSNITASGGVSVKYSQCTLSSTLVGAGGSDTLQILGLANFMDNAWGDAFTVARVRVNESQFQAAINAF